MRLLTNNNRPGLLSPFFSNMPSWFDDDDLNFFSGRTGTGMNMWEDENSITVEVPVPGLKESDIDINLENNVLSIRGVKEEKDETKEGRKIYAASMKSNFFYQVTLPSSADSDSVNADLENGVLKVIVGKSEKSKPRKIQIKAGSK